MFTHILSNFKIQKSLPKIIAIFGPTASGKSALALSIAQLIQSHYQIQTELICIDATTVYQGFNLGANKPTEQEQAKYPHHMLNIVTPHAHYHAGLFEQQAWPILQNIHQQQHVAILVVGTFLYYRALIYGLCNIPNIPIEIRQTLLEKEQKTPGYIANQVQLIDPISYQEAHGKNMPRLVRALEIYLHTGQTASALRQAHGFTTPRLSPIYKIGLNPERMFLNQRIYARTQYMLENGLIEEVFQLKQQGLSADLKPMQAIGYKQVNDWFNHKTSLEELHQKIVESTRQYAKKQISFFKQEKDIHWYGITQEKDQYQSMN